MMDKRAAALCVLLVLLGGLLSSAAGADDELYVTNYQANSVTVYSRTANGNIAPLRTLGGPATGLNGPNSVAIDLVNNEMYVSNFSNTPPAASAIHVFSRTANGNTAPLRSIIGAATGLSNPRGIALDRVHNELVVANFNNSVTVYSRTASGNVAPLRTIVGAATGLHNPGNIAVDLVHDELFVTNAVPPSVTVYGRAATGNAAPLRTLSGAATGLNNIYGLALDLTNNEFFVANIAIPGVVNAYGRTASGNSAPLRTLTGAATGLLSPFGIALDLTNNELVVASTVSDAVRVFVRTADENTAPVRSLVGAATALDFPVGLAITPRVTFLASVNQPTFTVGQTVNMSIGLVNNPGLQETADLYEGLVLPGGTILFVTPGGLAVGNLASLASFKPAVLGLSLATPFSTPVQGSAAYQWTGAEAHGEYVLFIFALRAGALDDGILTADEFFGLATANFSFN